MAMCDGGMQTATRAGGLLEWMAVAARMQHVRNVFGNDNYLNNVSTSFPSFSGAEWTSSVIQLLLSGLSSSSSGAERVGELVFRMLEDWVGIDIQNPSPVTKNLRLVTSPVPVVSCIALYIGTVWLWSSHIKKSGQKARKEDPLPLRCLVIVHNLFLCILSLVMGIGLMISARQLGYSLWGNVYRGDETEMGFLIYVFYVSKLYEFMDTAIMLFRRNLRQLTYLHVYHHASITFIWWIICYTCPGADAYFSAAFNSCIHVAMYLYYLLAATIAKDERRRRKYLFWGKYLTMMQMVQFLSFIGQSIYAMLRPETYPKGVPRLLFFYSVSLLLFFGNFFVKKYSRPQKSAKTD
ncbi:unnamed protein product [Calypogeia fissa]